MSSSILEARACMYASAIAEKTHPTTTNCIGFLDGTNIQIAMPSGARQRATYAGHKRFNCLKFQAVTAPDGLALHFYGPVEGRKHDVHILTTSGLEAQLHSKMFINGRQFCLYADSAYSLREYLLVGFNGSALSTEEIAMNRDLSRARVAVEWFFKEVKQYFSHVKVVQKMSVSRCPLGLWYQTSVVLWNFRFCIYGSPTSSFLSCPPPSLREYVELCLQ